MFLKLLTLIVSLLLLRVNVCAQSTLNFENIKWFEIKDIKVRGFLINGIEDEYFFLYNKPEDKRNRIKLNIEDVALAENIIKSNFKYYPFSVDVNFNSCVNCYRKIRKDIRLYYGYINEDNDEIFEIYSYKYGLKKPLAVTDFDIGLRIYSDMRRCRLKITLNATKKEIIEFEYF